MTTENKHCGISSFKDMPLKLQVLYVLVMTSLIFNTFVLIKLSRCNIANWIDKNPKAILDSVQKYVESEQDKLQKEQQKESKESIKANKDKIYSEKNVGVANKNGKKVIVQFFDYNCGYCKMAAKTIDKIIKEDKNVKVIFKEFPIFGGNSMLAAQYATAIAMTNPDKYLDFHSKLMEGDPKSEAGIEAAVKSANLSLQKIKKVMEDKKEEISKVLAENRDLANALGIQGTPAFIIGENFVPGYVDEETIKSLLK